MKISKEVKKMRFYESTLLSTYKVGLVSPISDYFFNKFLSFVICMHVCKLCIFLYVIHIFLFLLEVILKS